MSIQALNWAAMQELKPAQMAVLMLLANRANKQNSCWPSATNLSKALRCSKRHIQNTIDQLEEMELMKTEPRVGKRGRQTSNKYMLLIPVESPEEQRKARLKELQTWTDDPEVMYEAFRKDARNPDMTAVQFIDRWRLTTRVPAPEELAELEASNAEL